MTQTKSREVVIREAEFARLLARECEGFGAWVEAILAEPDLLESGNAVQAFEQEAHGLETFLDDYGARENRAFVAMGELVASIRGLSSVKATALHLSYRLGRYQILTDPAPLSGDLEAGRRTLDEAIASLLGEYRREAMRLGLEPASRREKQVPEGRQKQLLPRNLEEEDSVDERQHIAEIGAMFVKVLEASRSLDLSYLRPPSALAEFVSSHATEERCRRYESTVHSIQSMYDTYVLNTAVERDYPWLRSVRGHVSIALHLLEMATGLIHFYERHENDLRRERVRQLIAKVVSKDQILNLAVNVCLRQAYLYVEGASDLGRQILSTFVRQATRQLSLPHGVLLHARPLSLIAQIARRYGTPLEVSFDGESCSAGSLMSLILLAGRHSRPSSIEVRGDARALADLELLFEARLGEDGTPLPGELEYLRVRT